MPARAQRPCARPLPSRLRRFYSPQMNAIWRSGFRRRLSQFGSNGGSARDEILKVYLNPVQIGRGIFGVSEAAQSYFHKQVQDIELGASALLAGLIYAPLDLPSHVALPNARDDPIPATMQCRQTGVARS
ncbi:transglycosylase domain-containing protein [Bradyrhizobium sp. 164]|uniref:transglycosylase domain-containing protein n=1 Tax=Bradyrhizobium sp. 164 TaxID=2782637 RepID=UPI0032096D5A